MTGKLLLLCIINPLSPVCPSLSPSIFSIYLICPHSSLNFSLQYLWSLMVMLCSTGRIKGKSGGWVLKNIRKKSNSANAECTQSYFSPNIRENIVQRLCQHAGHIFRDFTHINSIHVKYTLVYVKHFKSWLTLEGAVSHLSL